MPHQVQSLITADYTPIITVPATTEVITQDALQDTAVALGSRIEYVRQFTNASEEPEMVQIIREDFHGASLDSGARLQGDFTWKTVSAGDFAVAHSGGTARRPGRLVLTMATDSSFAFGIGDIADNPLGFLTCELITFVARVTDDVGNLATSMTFGIKENFSFPNGGDNSIQFVYGPAFMPNWRIIVRKAGVQDTIDTGVPVVFGEFVTARLRWLPGADVECEIDGVVVHTILSADRPTGEANLGVTFGSSVVDAEVMVGEVDFIYARASITSTRSGPGT
jgi:hypothetical protein